MHQAVRRFWHFKLQDVSNCRQHICPAAASLVSSVCITVPVYLIQMEPLTANAQDFPPEGVSSHKAVIDLCRRAPPEPPQSPTAGLMFAELWK